MNDFWVTIVTMLIKALVFYMYILIASVVVSFLHFKEDNPILQVLLMVTEPYYKLIRRVIPSIYGKMDLAPVFGILLVQIVKYFLERTLYM